MFSNKEPRCYKNPEKNHVEYHNLAALRAATAVNGPKMCPKIVSKSLENQLKSYINRFLYKLEYGLTQTEAGLQKPCVFTVFLGPAPFNHANRPFPSARSLPQTPSLFSLRIPCNS